jgi:hypothetical protein
VPDPEADPRVPLERDSVESCHFELGAAHATFFTPLPSAFMTKNAHLGLDG